MNFELLLPLLITTLVAILGWIVAHRLAAKRDVANKRRELRTNYLINAYRKLESSANPLHPQARWECLELAIADIQLFGTPRQVKMAIDFAKTMEKDNSASADDLLFDLRRSLRAELQLEPVDANITYLRFIPNKIEDDIRLSDH